MTAARAVFLSAGIAVPALLAAAAQPGRSPLIDAAERLDVRKQLASTAIVARNNELSPCVPSDRVAFFESRAIDAGIWAGQFDVLSPGQGDWFLAVRGSADASPWRQRIQRAGEKFTSAAAAGETVDISLEGPGQPTGQCPRVVMRGELKGGRPATPRGVVGPDGRVDAMSPKFLALPDAATIATWAPSVVHLQVFDAQHGLPCTGFFVTAHLVLTARHCVMTPEEAANTSLELGATIVRDLKLLVSRKEQDFSLLLVNTSTPPPALQLRPLVPAELVVWQSVAARQQTVSVEDCKPASGAAGRFFHRCDTSVGTSGAPIQDRATGAVVALHTNGCTISGDPQCVNFGTPIAAIRQRLLESLAGLDQIAPAAAAELRAILQ